MAELRFAGALGASYLLVEVVGRGAAGEVWRAVDRRTDETVAAKLLRAEHVSDRDLVARFIQERSVLTELRDPHVVSVRDLVVEGDRLAIVMDFVGGGNLRDVLRERGPLRPALAAGVAAAVLDGLAAVHERRLVHRDVKPDNVLLTPAWERLAPGDLRLTDFGIARIIGDGPRTTTGLLGTPEYMSPELLTTGTADRPADVYAAGVLLYELLAGRTPFAGAGTDYTVAHRHVTHEPPRLPLPDDLTSLLDELLAKSPAVRPAAAAAADALRRIAPGLADLPALAPQVEPPDFVPARGPATLVRGLPADDPADDLADDRADGPGGEAGESGDPAPLSAALVAAAAGSGPETWVRPLSAPPAPTSVPRPSEHAGGTTGRWWQDRRVQAGAAATVALAAIVTLVMARGLGGGTGRAPVAAEPVTASNQDQAVPTGLTISRSARYDPAAQAVELTVTYSAQNAPLRGPFLEVIGGLAAGGCPAVTWQGGSQQRNLPSVSGVDAACSYSVDPGPVPRQGSVSVTARVGLALGAQDAQSRLSGWLDDDAAATLKAVSDPGLTSTAYPAQRLQDIDVVAPSRTVGGRTLPIRLVPVWPSGPDQLNPLYRSPSVGRPSSLLDAVAGGELGVRFSDACSGALAVSADGLVVTALRVAPECEVDATVGNFTALRSNAFTIATRGG